MTKHNIFAIGFLAAALGLSGAVIATAQDSATGATAQAEAAPAAVQDMLIRADHRGGERGRDRRGLSLGALLTDADGDGTITADEIDLARAALIAGADASGNGGISLEEYQTIFLDLMRDKMVDSFQGLDADGDGEIGTTEMDDAIAEIVERMDRNEDGIISADDENGRTRT
jgi:hypothetical protein